MAKLIVTVGSVTTATRLGKLLNKLKGIKCAVVHTPASINNGGCSYSLVTEASNISYIKEIAREYKLELRKFYIEETSEGVKSYHAVS